MNGYPVMHNAAKVYATYLRETYRSPNSVATISAFPILEILSLV